MAQKTVAELLSDAGTIKNETVAEANTASRVGAMLENMVESSYTTPFPQFTTTTSTTAYAGTTSPAIAAYITGQKFQVKIHATSTGDATLNLNTLGAKKVFTNPTTQATTDNLLINQVYILVYDAALDSAVGGFLMVGGGVSSGGVSDGNKGDITVSSSGAVWQLNADVDPIGVQDLFIPASAMWPRVTAGCTHEQYEMATSVVNVQGLAFDQTTQEFAQFQIILPRKWNIGTVTAVPYWTAIAGSGTVQFGISGGAYANDDALTVALGTPQTSDDTLIATNDLHTGPETSAITLSGTPADADFLVFQVSRNPASDTLSGDAILLGISIRITVEAAKDA